jgi:hypothetical protein
MPLPRHRLALLLSLVTAGAAEDSLANLVYLDDRLTVHPRVGVAGRYDSNVLASENEERDELAGIGLAGVGGSFAWSEATTLTADAEARLVVTDRPEARRRNQGSASIGAQSSLQGSSIGTKAAWERSDEPDELTGERLLVDTWSADVAGDRNGLVHRLSAGLAVARSDYRENSTLATADDRDENNYSATAGYGLKLDNGDEATLRLVGDLVQYDRTLLYQDSWGMRGYAGWSRQVSERVGVALELGAEYRSYEASSTSAARDIISPAFQGSVRNELAGGATVSVTLGGAVQDDINGNPALESKLAAAYSQPFTDAWAGRLQGEAMQQEDLESVDGQPEDSRLVWRGVVGTAYAFRPGLTADAEAGYEHSDSRLRGEYDRILVQAGVTARF